MTSCSPRRLPPLPAGPLRLDAPAQRIHEVYDLRRLTLARDIDLLAGLLLLQEIFERVFVAVLEPL
jgi:hypothetical protein